MSGYQAGQCNIGRDQRRRRATFAAVALVAAIGYVLCYLADWLPGLLLAGVFVPLAVAFEWGIQAYSAFCVRFALLNRYDLRGSGGDAGTVTDPTSQRADQRQAARITVAAVGLSGLVTGLLVVLL